jgi:uncharacterized protein YdhG (YjbR/CyaY superfamily)
VASRAFRDALAKYKNAKGSVQFPHDEPLPLGLVAEIVRFRVSENARAKGRAGLEAVMARRKTRLHS